MPLFFRRMFFRLMFSRPSALLLLLCACPPAWAIDESDLLPVDEAFSLSARAPTPDRIELDWKIADGYYLYRHRISAAAADPGDRAGTIELPPGKAHTDEFFGRVETYRGTVRGSVPDVVARGGRIALKVKYQGCADLGICYPPQTRTITVALATTVDGRPGVSAEGGQASSGGLAALGRALSGGGGGGNANATIAPGNLAPGAQAAPLPPERAFGFEAIADGGNALMLRFTPAPGYYLYRDRSGFELRGAEGVAAGRPRWPAGRRHRDEHFGDVVVYFDPVDVPLPLLRKRTDAVQATLVTTFQGCQSDGICYPPMTRELRLSIPAGEVGRVGAEEKPIATPALPLQGSEQTVATKQDGQEGIAEGNGQAGAAGGAVDASDAPGVGADTASVGTAPPTEPTGSSPASEPSGGIGADRNTDAPAPPAQAEDQRLAGQLAGSKRWLALLGFFGAGLLLAFTPCVLPMIPILSGLIAGHGGARGGPIGAGRAFALSLVYVLANAVMFTVAGVVAGLVGANLQAAFQAPWVLVLFTLLFVALALSMFGLYELQLPSALRARLGAMSERQRGGSWAGVAAMGALSALIVGPCVAPPLAAAVLYIGQARDPVFGGVALFALALGMGTPLLAFGMAAGRGLPTSGPWMVAVQRVFGFAFLALAVWMLSRILAGAATLALYGLLALAFATWLAALASPAVRPGLAEGRRWALRFAAAVFGVVGATQLLGAMAGGHDPLQPLAGVAGVVDAGSSGTGSGAAAPGGELRFRTIKSVADLDREVAAADAADKPLLLDFYADWCVSCKEMEKYTFPRPQVRSTLDGFVLLKADVTANDATDQALMRRLGIIGPPATLYYAGGRERRELRLFGFEDAAAFARRAQRAVR